MPNPLAPLLLRQQGVLHRAQAVAAGLRAGEIDELVRSGRWLRILPGVYLVGAMPEHLTAQAELRIRAARLWTGDCVLAGRTAAWWNGWLPETPRVIEVCIAHHRELSKQPGFLLRRCVHSPADLVRRREVWSTSAARTALDLAAVGCTDLLDAQLRTGLFDAAALTAALERGTGQRGWKQARTALAECASRPFSAPERMLHRALRAAGIAGWTANERLLLDGTPVVPDLLFEQARLVIEVDGHQHHSSRADFERDRVRQNLLTRAGYRILRFTWWQLVHDMDGVIRQIVAELGIAA